MKKFKIFGLGVLFMTVVTIGARVTSTGATQNEGKFVNTEIKYNPSLGNLWDMVVERFNTKRTAAEPAGEVPLKSLSQAQLQSSDEDAIFRLGHSTILMRLNGEYVMTDPVFSERASPVQWAGPKRFHPTPISIEDLPNIKVVIISHDHYDHLDKAAIKKLANKVEHFVTPLKVGDYLIDWGVEKSKVTQLDWWQDVQLGNIHLVATPAQHFSGRSLFDRDETLWASWVIQSDRHNLFFSGDGGYFDGFKEIGEKYGPFDVTMIETGAYNDLWADIHMLPEHSMQAHLDLKGKAMLPIHNGTFDLSMHDWFEPFERITELAKQNNVNLLTPVFGDAIELDNPVSSYAWWREAQETKESALALQE
ncbi:MBL fold metallo-hydrolase [Vibrio sp. DW001]|uniref:MBL fold metallo-hydrolase n=1 Tax=Vibrio sp. DW001 TaxID=2912315 RepID=UPI0023AF8BD6|nr:MBL fold metallo-hydrolase [Vibrio sp. DW001]WED27791.1 MBL fold metallo-hydrolase [Vibrio sp. DW001]